jgi:hypothetical protein
MRKRDRDKEAVENDFPLSHQGMKSSQIGT